MVVSVSNEECRPLRPHTQTSWLRELNMLKGSINETSVTCPCQGSAHFCHGVDHFNLGWSGGRKRGGDGGRTEGETGASMTKDD